MRVIAGEFKGRTLRAPAGTHTRPTSSRAREALFSILGPLDGLRVLDAFAGSGALGIEAISRGADQVIFAENEHRALAALRENLRMLGLRSPRAQVVTGTWQRAVPAGPGLDLVFIDPPYEVLGAISSQLPTVLGPALAPHARVVIESPAREPSPIPTVWGESVRRERTYGTVRISVISPATLDPGAAAT